MLFEALSISIHALREEGDRRQSAAQREQQHFYPRPPRGGRPIPADGGHFRSADFYPRPPRGGRPTASRQLRSRRSISIHALREEGDLATAAAILIFVEFLSTPSARRATSKSRKRACCWRNFYPRPPRGGRHGFCKVLYWSKEFLSTPSARRATCLFGGDAVHDHQFLSTPSARRATTSAVAVNPALQISIHALREEGDLARDKDGKTVGLFLSTPSARRATVSVKVKRALHQRFLSTPSARRATSPAARALR